MDKGLYREALDALEAGGLMLPGEVGALFRVDAKTVTRWSAAGKLPAIKTIGGHRRYRAADVKAALEKDGIKIEGVAA